MKLLVIFILLFVHFAYAKAQTRVLMVLNEGFQPDEYFRPREIFEKEGYHIRVASRFGQKVFAGIKYNLPGVRAEVSFEQINVSEYDIITFSGGGGAWTDYFPNRHLHQVLLAATRDEKKIVGLICAATGLLGMASNLDGKTPQFSGRKATGYGEVRGILTVMGKLNYSEGDLNKGHVVVDKNLITGRDPISSVLFGETIVNMIKKRTYLE